MQNLLIDIGNTSVKLALSQGVNITETVKSSREEIIKASSILIKDHLIETAALSTVCGEDLLLEEYFKSISRRFIKVRGDIPLPFKNLYKTPATLGADRICALAAAKALFPSQECIIFDFGTAVTIDFLNKKGEYEGGNISLGMATRFKAINQYTKQLPLLSPSEEIMMKGDSTIQAVTSGIILGIMFEIEGYIKKYPGHTVVFTGGDAIYFAKKMKSPIFVVYNLVLKGLAQIAVINAATE